jgi:anionic cell wall polymer biosynthesis LytR-Cps2A-Psr (LCP) family protein
MSSPEPTAFRNSHSAIRIPLWLIVTLVVVAVVGLAGLGGWLVSRKGGKGPESAIRNPHSAVPRSDLGDTFNILMVGRDARLLGDPGLDGKRRNKRESVFHSDIIIIAHFNLVLRRVALLSIPRDMLVSIPGFSHPDDRLDFHAMDKITHVSAYGRDSLLRKTIEQNYGIRIRREMALDFDSFRMGFGLLQPFLGKLAFGNRELSDPEQALMFVRDRRHFANDDLDRSRHSVLFVKTIVQRLWKKLDNRFASWLAGQMLNLLGGDTDVTADDLQYIVGGLRRGKFSPDSIETAVMIGVEAPVTLYSYGQTLSCCLPVYGEIEKQVDFYLRDRLETTAFSFMEQNQKIPWPGYVFGDYDLMPDTARTDSLNPEYRRALREKGESLKRDSARRADSLRRRDTAGSPARRDTARKAKSQAKTGTVPGKTGRK